MIRRLLPALLCALALAPAAPAANGMFVGAAEDAPRSEDAVTAKVKVDLARLAGFDALRLTSIWTPGETAPNAAELNVLQNAGLAGQLNGVRIILSVYHRDQRTTPLTTTARAQFAAYVASIARDAPGITDFIIGNEPNLNLFWMPQYTRTGANAAAPAYLRLLAQTYDALKAVSPDINVIGGSVSPRGQDKFPSPRHTHSPTTFITDLGTAYRRSGRTKPVMVAFAFDPYLIPSRLPPTFTNPRNTTIALSDYGKLVRLLTRAFAGTAQPGATLPIVYDEFGYQSQIPAHKRSIYTNLNAPAARDAIPEAQQAAYYRQSLAIAQCQPNVAGMLFFHVSDEADALRWQSGIFYADDTPKTSMPAVRDAAIAARAGTLARCAPKRVNPLREVAFPNEPQPTADARTEVTTENKTWKIELTCDTPCRYVARIERLAFPPARVLEAAGFAGTTEQTIEFPAETLSPGAYQYRLRVFATGRPGSAVERFSRPFNVVRPADPPAGGGSDATPPSGGGSGATPPGPPASPAPFPFPICKLLPPCPPGS